mmetsp:Transcript_61096/g.157548  ORF Transcript_61096/g.157548 Transcript_61096/m.157548 type:complete len:221 (-) Transcript_61096:328-990(-)
MGARTCGRTLNSLNRRLTVAPSRPLNWRRSSRGHRVAFDTKLDNAELADIRPQPTLSVTLCFSLKPLSACGVYLEPNAKAWSMALWPAAVARVLILYCSSIVRARWATCMPAMPTCLTAEPALSLRVVAYAAAAPKAAAETGPMRRSPVDAPIAAAAPMTFFLSSRGPEASRPSACRRGAPLVGEATGGTHGTPLSMVSWTPWMCSSRGVSMGAPCRPSR